MSRNKKAKAAADKAAASNLSSSFKEQRAQALEAAAAYLTAAQEKAGPLASQASEKIAPWAKACLLYTSPSPRDQRGSRMPSSA